MVSGQKERAEESFHLQCALREGTTSGLLHTHVSRLWRGAPELPLHRPILIFEAQHIKIAFVF